jgi:hypothetical protein
MSRDTVQKVLRSEGGISINSFSALRNAIPRGRCGPRLAAEAGHAPRSEVSACPVNPPRYDAYTEPPCLAGAVYWS